MATSVQTIIANAIYISTQDRVFNPSLNGIIEQYALNQLNFILDEWRDKIPFTQVITFNNITNLQNTTFVQVDTVNYILNTVSYPLVSVDIVKYQLLNIVIGLLGFPEIYYFDQLSQTINIYPLPSNPSYQFTVAGRINNINLGLSDTIPANMPLFMVNAVTYELGFRICGSYGFDWNQNKEAVRQQLLSSLIRLKDIDLTPNVDMVFPTPQSSLEAPFPFFFYLSGGGNG